MKLVAGSSLIALSMLSSAMAVETPAVAHAPPQEATDLFVRRMLDYAVASGTPTVAPTPAHAADDTMDTKPLPETDPAQILAAELVASRPLRELDAKIAIAYGQALNRVVLYPKISKALRYEQDTFTRYKEEAASYGVKRLEPLMESWLPWLNAIDAPRPGFEGTWTSSGGNVKITPRTGGGYDVVATGDMPITGTYHCELSGIGRVSGNAMNLSEDGLDDMDGWTVTLQRSGGILHMEQHQNNSERLKPDYCGAVNLLGDDYMPTRNDPGLVKAWQ